MAPVLREFPTPVTDQQHLNQVSILVGISQLFDDKIERGAHRLGLSLNPHIARVKLHLCVYVRPSQSRLKTAPTINNSYRLILINSDRISSLVVITLELA